MLNGDLMKEQTIVDIDEALNILNGIEDGAVEGEFVKLIVKLED